MSNSTIHSKPFKIFKNKLNIFKKSIINNLKWVKISESYFDIEIECESVL